MLKHFKENPIVSSIIISEILSISIGLITYLIKDGDVKDLFPTFVVVFIMGGIFLIYPFLLTLINTLFLFLKVKDVNLVKSGKIFEYITIVLGIIYSFIAFSLYEIKMQSNWMEKLINNQVHTPIFTKTYPTIIFISILAFIGYFVLSLVPLKKMPPLLIVCSIAGMYPGIGVCILWIIQVFSIKYIFLMLFPLNCIIIAAKVIKSKISEWKVLQNEEEKIYEKESFNKFNQILMDANKWPVLAFVIMWPYLGILICILSLFGQQPDSFIKAWTETADWNLSKCTAPQNIQYDEHYLCTVAAGGHKRIVKPIRCGVRHGHRVIVNRQLCIANAFEQIIEEKMPLFHKCIRGFYDKYGFPIAKLIKSKYTADLIYFIMKPLEFIFIIVIYFCDVKPENRISLQYITKPENVGR